MILNLKGLIGNVEAAAKDLTSDSKTMLAYTKQSVLANEQVPLAI
ncbi:hypothetical protein [Desulfosporosinus sp. BICA1-9]|nr:hypothetical protein [Desulfosporosinus sp. BICA1-9]